MTDQARAGRGGRSSAVLICLIYVNSPRREYPYFLPMLDTELDEIECLRGLRVLVVEDAPSVAKALRNMLEDFGVVVVGPVSTPDAALQLLTEFSPDLVLVDMHLDGFTGYALVERMRRLGVPVLAVSGSAELPREGPKVATLQKPFSGQALLTIICQLVCAPLPI